MSAFGRLCTRFGRFNVVGLMGAALQLVLLDVLVERFGLPGVAAAPIAVETVVLHNFFWHERFTWRDQGTVRLRQRAGRLWRFHASNGLISLAGNTLLTYCLSHRLKLPSLVAAVTAIALCSPINFLAANCWVYREPPLGVRRGGLKLDRRFH
jgi:putative flippase GtrA